MTKIERAKMVLPLLLACAAPVIASAQTTFLQDSRIVGVGKTLSISRLPVIGTNGATKYYDVSVALAFSTTGVPILSGRPFTPSLPLVTNGFIAGRYYVKAGTCATQFADVTSGVGSGGSTVWSLVLETPASCNGAYPNQATWQTGAPAPDVAARLNNAKVPNNPNYSYGLTEQGDGDNGAFSASDGFLAAEQVNNQLVLVSYTGSLYSGGHDQSGQSGSITFGLCANSTCSSAPP